MKYVYKIKCVYEKEVEIEADNNEEASFFLDEELKLMCYDGSIDSCDFETDLLNVYRD